MHELDKVLLHWGVKGMKWDEDKKKQKEDEIIARLAKERGISISEARQIRQRTTDKNHPVRSTIRKSVDAFKKIVREKGLSPKQAKRLKARVDELRKTTKGDKSKTTDDSKKKNAKAFLKRVEKNKAKFKREREEAAAEKAAKEAKKGRKSGGGGRKSGGGKSSKSEQTSPISKDLAGKTVDQIAQEVISGKLGNGKERRNLLGDQYDAVQKKVNELLGAKPTQTAKVSTKSTGQLVDEVLKGLYGNGEARKKALGSEYARVQQELNRLRKGKTRVNSKKERHMGREVR